MKKWKIRVLHLSHTDIGYKDTQAKIIAQQTRNLLEVLEKFEKNETPDGWKWNIEAFGTIVDFLKNHKDKEELLIKLINEGKIGISCNYWNFSKLASREVINASFERIKNFASKLKTEASSLITNDINGYALAWAEEAKKVGVNNLFFGLHTHHGFYPAFRKQYPFWWEMPNGEKSLVWIGEQYAFGNNMGIVPGPISDYIAKDGLTAGVDFNEQIELANRRIKEYTESLEKDSYPFDIIPISTLGTGADNDPANYKLSERIEFLKEEWKQFGVEDITMVTVDEFFEEIRKQDLSSVPTYKGEWPDWWTDGTGAMPQAMRAFRDAQRNYSVLKRSKADVDLKQIEDDLLLFSEHTFGTEDPIRHGHDQYNFIVEKSKSMFAFRAMNDTFTKLSEISNWTSHRDKDEDKITIKVTNPFNVGLQKTIKVDRFLGWSEKDRFLALKKPVILDGSKEVKYTVEVIPHPTVAAWSEKSLFAHIDLKANETKELTINLTGEKANGKKMSDSFATMTAEFADDVENPNRPKEGIKYDNHVMESEHYIISFGENGISQMKSKTLGKDFIDETFENIFSPVYLIDEIKDYDRNKLFLQRRHIGKNRLSYSSKKFVGKLQWKKVDVSENRQDATITMRYEIKNSSFYEVVMKISNAHYKIHVQVNVNKNSEWSMESMFISLPFVGKRMLDYDNLYEVNKGQIDGTLIDYHSIQEGMQIGDMLINQLDTSLVWTSDFSYGNRKLASQDDTSKRGVYSWILNNNWETNFPADTGGFHAFRYVIEPKTKDENVSEKLLANASDMLIERI